MKTTFWGLFVLIQLILHLGRNESDALASTGRSFYIIGHMANDISQVEKHLAEGANALEIDVQFSPGARPVRTNHGFPCCFRDCYVSEVFSYMLKYLRDLSTPEHPEYTQQLSLIKMNLKVRSFSNDMIYTAGERLAEALMVYLFDGGFSGSNVWVLLSVPSPQQVILFQGVRDAFRRYDMAGLLDRIGYTIGDNTELLTIQRSLDHLGIIDHIWIGDGSSSCLGGIRSRNRMERLVEERDIGEGNFDRVFHWTVDESLSMRTSLRTGIDAIITNRPDRLLEILAEDEFYGRFRLATADDRPWDKVIEDESLLNFFPPEDNFGSSDILPTSADNDQSTSSALVLSNGDPPAISIDSLSLTEDGIQETGKNVKDCNKETSLSSLLDDIAVKDAETEKPDIETTTTAKPEDDDNDALASLIKEIENSPESSGRRLSLSGRSTDRLFGRSLLPNSELQEMLEKLNENKEAKLTSDLIELIGKMSATPETPSIPASALQALISIQAATATPSPSVPIGVLQALVGHSDSSSNILRLLNPPAQTVSPELLRMLLNLYSPTTPPPGIPLHVVEALVGIQQRTTTSNVNLDVLKLLSGSNSNLPLDVVLSLIKPTNVNNNAVSVDLVKALVKAMSDKDKPTDKETLPVATEPDVVRRTTKNKKNNALKGKESENENESKTKDAVSETLLDEDLIDLSLSDVETTTKKEKRVSSNGKNLTRNFPERGGPPLPAIPGTSVIANFGPHGIHWKVLDKPGSHLRSPNPFIFSGSPQFGDRPPHIFNDRPLYQFHPPLRPLFQTNLPNYKVTIHQPINLHNPLRHPVKSVGRFPKNINIHVPIPAPRPYMQKPPIMYPSSTPCPEPSNYNYQPKPNHQQSQLLFPALRPPTLPGNTHLPFKPEVPSVHPLLPQRPSFPRPTVPDFENSFGNSFGPSFEPPIFIDDIDSIDDFLKKKKNNNSHNIPKDLFSSVKGSQETNFSSEINILEESGKNPSINSQVSLDSFEEQTRVNSRRVTTTEKPEIDSVDDIIDALRLEEDIATTTADPFEELMTAFEKINKDKDAVENFLKRANLSTSLTTIAPTLRIDNTEPRISTVEPHKYNLQQIFNLPPTAGLGWNGESINQAKLEQILDKQKPDRQVVIIENSPLIVVPPETATWPNRNVVHKRETTPPPDDDYDEFFGTTPISRPGNKPLPITISKPSEGLVKSGGKRKLMPGEVEIEIPGELFAQVSAGDDKKKTLAKFIENLDLVDKQSTEERNNNITLELVEKENAKDLLMKDRNDKIIQLKLNTSLSDDNNSNNSFETKETIEQLKLNNASRVYDQQLKPNGNLRIDVQQLKPNSNSRINIQESKLNNDSKVVDQSKLNSASQNVLRVTDKPIFSPTKPSTGQRRHGGVSLRHPNVPYTIVNSVNPTTPYPRRVLQKIRPPSKRPNVHIHYRGSGKAIENLYPTTSFPVLYHTMKSQVRKMQEQSEQSEQKQKYS